MDMMGCEVCGKDFPFILPLRLSVSPDSGQISWIQITKNARPDRDSETCRLARSRKSLPPSFETSQRHEGIVAAYPTLAKRSTPQDRLPRWQVGGVEGVESSALIVNQHYFFAHINISRNGRQWCATNVRPWPPKLAHQPQAMSKSDDGIYTVDETTDRPNVSKPTVIALSTLVVWFFHESGGSALASRLRARCLTYSICKSDRIYILLIE